MSIDYTYFLREFRTREELAVFIRSELNDRACADDAVSLVFEPGRGWVLLVRSPNRQGVDRDRLREREGRSERKRGDTDSNQIESTRPTVEGTRSYGAGRPNNPHREVVERIVTSKRERAIDRVGRRGTDRYKLPGS